jgi:hypothetical protein
MDVEIIDQGLDEYFQAIEMLEGKVINAGVLSSAGGDIASIAFWNHEGTSRGIPPRPFVMQAVETKQAMIGAALKASIAAIMTPGDVQGALDRIGLSVQTAIKQTIKGGSFAANHPDTIKRKGSSSPLIDTGRLIGSIGYEIK